MIQPLLDNVLIRPDKTETKNEGGILIPQSTDKKTQMGTVIAIGLGLPSLNTTGFIQRIPLDVKVNDRVFYKTWSAHEIQQDQETLVIIKQSDILSIL